MGKRNLQEIHNLTDRNARQEMPQETVAQAQAVVRQIQQELRQQFGPELAAAVERLLNAEGETAELKKLLGQPLTELSHLVPELNSSPNPFGTSSKRKVGCIPPPEAAPQLDFKPYKDREVLELFEAAVEGTVNLWQEVERRYAKQQPQRRERIAKTLVELARLTKEMAESIDIFRDYHKGKQK